MDKIPFIMRNLKRTFFTLNTLGGKFNMNVKGMCLFFHVSLLVMCGCCFGATGRTHEINCHRGNKALTPTGINCWPSNQEVTCTWLLGIQYDNSNAIDTSCNYIRSDESVQMFFQLVSWESNDYETWEPCPNQSNTSCTWFDTNDYDEFAVMVIANNNKLNICIGYSIAYFEVTVKCSKCENEAAESVEHIDHPYVGDNSEETQADIAKANLEPTYYPGSTCENEAAESVGHIDNPYVGDNSEGTQADTAKANLEPTYYPEQIFTAITLAMAAAGFGYLLIATYHWIRRQWICQDCANEREHKGEFTKISSDKLMYSRSGCTVVGSWTECIKRKCVVLASEILKEDVLPTDSELQSICGTFGKRSETLRNVCTKICKTVQGKLEKVEKVWPAYTLSSDEIVFVAESDTCMTSSDIMVCGFRIHLNGSKIPSMKESKIVMLKKKERLAQCYDKYGVEKFKMLKQIISENAEKLMNKHKFINAITPGVAKSIGYLTSGHKLNETLCISIYVDKKVRNLIPLEEDPLPRLIDNFPIDVLEGKFQFFGKEPNDYQNVIKMGCGIHARVKTDNGDTMCGTLGGFVKHKEFGLCCITSAHVVLSDKELQETKRHSYAKFKDKETKEVFEPFCEQSEPFGIVVDALYKEGEHCAPSVEAALIQIKSRKPTSGSFPDANTDFVFDSGNVIDANLLRPMTEVYKFGMATGPTTGYIGQEGAAVRVRSSHLDGVRLNNQLEIIPKDESVFADHGDSGALVFIRHLEWSAAIGIIEGGLDGTILVTPIIDVLRALNCPRYLYRFGQDLCPCCFKESKDSGINLQCAEGGNVEEDMDSS